MFKVNWADAVKSTVLSHHFPQLVNYFIKSISTYNTKHYNPVHHRFTVTPCQIHQPPVMTTETARILPMAGKCRRKEGL